MKKGLLPIILVAGLLILMSVPSVDAVSQLRIADVDYVSIVDAYYADLDGDGYEDDIKLLVEFSFPTDEIVRVDLNIWIELPSGLTFNLRVSVWRAPNDSLLNIDCIDMAIESGWYTVYLVTSVMGSGGGKYYITDFLIFDPPGEGGSGLPGISAYF